MIKKYLKLTKEQKARGIYFSSQFKFPGEDHELHEITLEELNQDPKKAREKEERLRDDKFFRGWGFDSKYNCIHEIRS